MNSHSTKARHRIGLAKIAGVCCLALFVAYSLPHLLLAMALKRAPSPEEKLSFADRNREWLRREVPKLPYLWAYHRADFALTNVLPAFGRRAKLHPDVVFMAIDTASFDQSELSDEERQDPALQMMSNGFPFPRAVYPLIIKRLADAGAKAIMFDILFPGPKQGDEDFSVALERYRDRVVIGSNLQTGDAENGAELNRVVTPSPSLLLSDDRLYDNRVGYVNFKPDFDGVVRQAIYRTTMLDYFGQPGDDDTRELLSLTAQGVTKAGLGSLLPKGRDPVYFRYVDHPRPRSLHDIFVPDLWAHNYANGDFFKGKLVFIGPYGNWSKDELLTPFGSMLGPEIHISALNAILQKDYLRQSSQWADVFFILLGGVAAIAAGFSVNDPVRRIFLLLGIVAAFAGVAFTAYFFSGYIVSLLGPTAALLSSGLAGLIWERRLEQKERERVRGTLERYVSKDVVKEVLDNPQSFLNTEGGMRKPITVLFSDIRGFTTIAESADASKLVMQLNEYFTEMVRIVFAHRGTLDKFIGDAVMAHWGSIVSRGAGPDACRGVAAALDMLQVLPKLNAGWKERGLLELKIGVGVNHGDAICAHIGSEEKHEVTAIGDAVNLASRLEGATKEFQQDLLIGPRVAELVRDHYHLRSVDLLQVKGKTLPVEVFAVLGDRKESEAPSWLPTYHEAIGLFRQREFVAAQARFMALQEDVPDDYLIAEYLRRCEHYLENAPEEDWAGAYVMTKK